MLRFAALMLVSGIIASSIPHQVVAAEPGFCRDYAQSAVDQTRFVRERPGCSRDAQGPRWSMNFRAHYDWCLGARYRDAEMERAIRHDYIESCRHGG